MRATDSVSLTWAATGAGSAFALVGGLYAFSAASGNWNGGNVALQQLLPDQTTWMTVGTALSANGENTANLSPGQYRFNVTTTSAGSVNVCRIPND